MHIATKTADIKKKGPNHITPDFQIGIIIPDVHLKVEIAKYVELGLAQMKLPITIPDTTEVVDWRKKNLRLVNRLIGKLVKLRTIAPTKMDERVQKYLEDFLSFKSVLEDINATSPQLYEKFVRLRDATERTIETFSDVGAVKDGRALTEQMDGLAEKIKTEFGTTFDLATVECLVRGVFSDWLMRCPVDFPEVNQ